MADLSLDDYIQKKNFRVQIKNDNWNNNGNNGNNIAPNTRRNQNMTQNRGPSVTITGLGHVQQFDARQKLGPKITFDARQRLQSQKPGDARTKLSGRRGRGRGRGQGNGFRQTITTPGAAQPIYNAPGSTQPIYNAPGSTQPIYNAPGSTQPIYNAPGSTQPIYNAPGSTQPIYNAQVVRQPAYSNPVARQPITFPGERVTKVMGLGRQVGPSGAAPSIAVRLGNQGNDARSKIISLKKQKGTFDARSLIIKPQPHQQQLQQQPKMAAPGFRTPVQAPGMTVVRNVNNAPQTPAQPITHGSRIQLTTAGLQVTRAVPDATVSFEGSMLTVTKRRQDYQPAEEPSGGDVINYQFTQDPEPDYQYEDDDNQLDLDDTEDFKPQILQIKKTIKMSPVAVQSAHKTFIQPGLKRKAPVAAPLQSSGPLKLIKPTSGAHVPVITPPKRSKMAVPAPRPIAKQPRMQIRETFQEQQATVEPPSQDFLSPLQGYRVYVTNLHPVVNQDDIIELFGAIGALRKAKLIKQGTAEVVYIKKEDAMKSVTKYHNRELDGLPMQVKVLTSTTAAIKSPSSENDNGHEHSDTKNRGPLKLLKQPSSTTSASSILQAQADAESNVELPLVHKALFKLGPPGSSKPVTFTVKI